MSASCIEQAIDFIVKEDDPEMAAVEDDIRKNLEAIGIKVNTKVLSSTEYIDAELNGLYNVLFTRTWGAPYDPHSYMASWAVPSHVEYSAIGGMEAPNSRELLISKIEKVQRELDPIKIRAQWKEIHQDVHSQAIFMPLWGTRIPYVRNRRLAGFVPAEQAFSIPVNIIQVFSGSTSVTVSPGVGSLFSGTGPINPHQYSPNELWAQDWIYEGLVSYG
jgi:nickel transport system substrate-binding protein